MKTFLFLLLMMCMLLMMMMVMMMMMMLLPRQIKAGEPYIREGDVGTFFGIILSGKVRSSAKHIIHRHGQKMLCLLLLSRNNCDNHHHHHHHHHHHVH
jgi:hypothetical protein